MVNEGIEQHIEENDDSQLGYDPEELVNAVLSGKVSSNSSTDDDEGNDLSTILKPKIPREMPRIDHLPNAFTQGFDGKPQPNLSVGSRIVIERRASILDGNPWLDTRVYEIREIDQESCILKLWDPELRHHARDNYKIGFQVGSRYKIPPTKGRWDVAPKVTPVVVPTPEALQISLEGTTTPRKRGRPKGSKNRSKEAIKAEKEQLRAMKSEKKQRRKVK